MSRYDKYIEEIRIDISSKIITFFFDDGTSVYYDNGHLAEILINANVDRR